MAYSLIDFLFSVKRHVNNADANTSSSPDGGENSPIEQVALTVPVGDDPSLPSFTFRTWILGTLACALLSFLNQFFGYRREPLSVTAISAQIAVVPAGHLMAAAVTRRVFMRGTKWEFTLNPGKFNVKEHVLITIFASSGAASVYAIHFVSAVKVFYRKELTVLAALLVVITTQVLGFGWAGVFRRYLVEPATMWWPQNLVQVSLFRYARIFTWSLAHSLFYFMPLFFFPSQTLNIHCFFYFYFPTFLCLKNIYLFFISLVLLYLSISFFYFLMSRYA